MHDDRLASLPFDRSVRRLRPERKRGQWYARRIRARQEALRPVYAELLVWASRPRLPRHSRIRRGRCPKGDGTGLAHARLNRPTCINVNSHGTSRTPSTPGETMRTSQAFGEHALSWRSSAPRAWIGHLLALACGVAWCLRPLSLRHRGSCTRPSTSTPRSAVWTWIRPRTRRARREWSRPGNSFGFGSRHQLQLAVRNATLSNWCSETPRGVLLMTAPAALLPLRFPSLARALIAAAVNRPAPP